MKIPIKGLKENRENKENKKKSMSNQGKGKNAKGCRQVTIKL